jgi:hypothetical protein
MHEVSNAPDKNTIKQVAYPSPQYTPDGDVRQGIVRERVVAENPPCNTKCCDGKQDEKPSLLGANPKHRSIVEDEPKIEDPAGNSDNPSMRWDW